MVGGNVITTTPRLGDVPLLHGHGADSDDVPPRWGMRCGACCQLRGAPTMECGECCQPAVLSRTTKCLLVGRSSPAARRRAVCGEDSAATMCSLLGRCTSAARRCADSWEDMTAAHRYTLVCGEYASDTPDTQRNATAPTRNVIDAWSEAQVERTMLLVPSWPPPHRNELHRSIKSSNRI